MQEANLVFAAIDAALMKREERAAAQQAMRQKLPLAAAKPPLAAPLGGGNSAAAAAAAPVVSKFAAAAGAAAEAPPGKGEDESAAAVEAVPTSELRAALVAEVSGLAETIQEVCSTIRADTSELTHLPVAHTESPRRQATEVCTAPVAH
jgi:hypothetical protein